MAFRIDPVNPLVGPVSPSPAYQTAPEVYVPSNADMLSHGLRSAMGLAGEIKESLIDPIVQRRRASSYMNAANAATQRMQDFRASLEEDMDYDTQVERFDAEMQAIRDDIGQNLRGPQAAYAFEQFMVENGNAMRGVIASSSARSEHAFQSASVQKDIEDAVERLDADQAHEFIAGAVAAGLMNSNDAETAREFVAEEVTYNGALGKARSMGLEDGILWMLSQDEDGDLGLSADQLEAATAELETELLKQRSARQTVADAHRDAQLGKVLTFMRENPDHVWSADEIEGFEHLTHQDKINLTEWSAENKKAKEDRQAEKDKAQQEALQVSTYHKIWADLYGEGKLSLIHI